VPNLTVYHDTQSVSTCAYTGAGGQWWTFDDTWSIGRKTAYLKSRNLLGAMIWEMSGDTPSGTLITALDSGLRQPRAGDGRPTTTRGDYRPATDASRRAAR